MSEHENMSGFFLETIVKNTAKDCDFEKHKITPKLAFQRSLVDAFEELFNVGR